MAGPFIKRSPGNGDFAVRSRDHRATMVETGEGGGGIMAGVVISGVLLLGLLFVFGDGVFSEGARRSIDSNLARIDAPAK